MNGRSHDEFATNAAGYALGVLDPVEHRQFEAHLATCAQCRADVAQYRRVTAGLALGEDPVPVPASLRAGTLARATASADPGRPVHDKTPPGRFVALMAAASLLLAFGAGIYAWSLQTRLRATQQLERLAAARAVVLRDELTSSRQDSARLGRMVDVLTAPDVTRVELAGTSSAPTARAHAFWSRSRGLFVTADRLPALRSNRIYQLWLVLPNQAPISAGLLSVAANGSGSTLGTLPSSVSLPRATQATFAITEEPAAGSPAPTTPILLAGSTKTE